MELDSLGWSPQLAEAFEPHAAAGFIPGRVAVEHRSRYELLGGGAAGEWEATLSGRLRHEARGKRDLPAVGDWVVCDMGPPGRGAQLVAVLPRRSVFVRKAAGRDAVEQIVAANVDVAFVVSSMNGEFSARRLERYLTLAFESGAEPVVVLSKADQCEDREAHIRAVREVAIGIPLHVSSALTGDGIQTLLEHLTGHRTGALLGSSGVGKSTLVNALVGFDRQATAAVREADGKGRHTTTRRELVLLPGGGLLIDTPGMRELQLTDAVEGLEAAFGDVEELAAQCSFRDCTHGPEPGCAVKGAISSGKLGADRLESYFKLQAEQARFVRKPGKAGKAGRMKRDG